MKASRTPIRLTLTSTIVRSRRTNENHVNYISRFRKVLSKDSKSIKSIKKEDGIWTNSVIYTLHLLASTNPSNCTDAKTDRQLDQRNRHCTGEDVNLIERIVSKWDIDTLKPNKSHGRDFQGLHLSHIPAPRREIADSVNWENKSLIFKKIQTHCSVLLST